MKLIYRSNKKTPSNNQGRKHSRKFNLLYEYLNGEGTFNLDFTILLYRFSVGKFGWRYVILC